MKIIVITFSLGSYLKQDFILILWYGGCLIFCLSAHIYTVSEQDHMKVEVYCLL